MVLLFDFNEMEINGFRLRISSSEPANYWPDLSKVAKISSMNNFPSLSTSWSTSTSTPRRSALTCTSAHKQEFWRRNCHAHKLLNYFWNLNKYIFWSLKVFVNISLWITRCYMSWKVRGIVKCVAKCHIKDECSKSP